MAGLFSRITRRAAPPRAPGPERATVSDSPVSAWLERSSEATARPSAPGWGSRNGAPAPPVTPEPAAPPAPAPPVTPEPVAPPDRPLVEEIAPAPEPISRPVSPPPAPEPPTRTLPPVAPPSATAPATGSDVPPPADGAEGRPSFRHRARLRRRVRYLRRLRQVQLRDLGGLVLELDRAGRDPGDLVRQKLDGLRGVSTELTALEGVLGDPTTLLELREPGVGGSCPRCRAVHGSADAFCASCGQNVAAGRKVNG